MPSPAGGRGGSCVVLTAPPGTVSAALAPGPLDHARPQRGVGRMTQTVRLFHKWRGEQICSPSAGQHPQHAPGAPVGRSKPTMAFAPSRPLRRRPGPPPRAYLADHLDRLSSRGVRGDPLESGRQLRHAPPCPRPEPLSPAPQRGKRPPPPGKLRASSTNSRTEERAQKRELGGGATPGKTTKTPPTNAKTQAVLIGIPPKYKNQTSKRDAQSPKRKTPSMPNRPEKKGLRRRAIVTEVKSKRHLPTRAATPRLLEPEEPARN